MIDTTKIECRLGMFLYLLMRGHLPSGIIAGIVQEIEKCGDLEPVYSAKGLADYANELAKRIIGENK